jgi:hypothetical protein
MHYRDFLSLLPYESACALNQKASQCVLVGSWCVHCETTVVQRQRLRKRKKAANPQAKNKKQTENMKNGFTERQREEEGDRKTTMATFFGWCCSFLFAFFSLVIALAAFLCGRGLQLFVLFS